MKQRAFAGFVLSTMGVLVGSGCLDASGREAVGEQAEEDIAGASESLVGTAPARPYWESVVQVGGCTGTVVGPRHIITASHCVSRRPHWYPSGPGQTLGVVRDPAVSTVPIAYAREIFPHYNADAAIIITDVDLNIEPIRILNGPLTNDWVGRRVLVAGFGGDNTKRLAWFTLDSFQTTNNRFYQFQANPSTSTCQGDSGGPHFAKLDGSWYLVGLTKTGLPLPCGSGPYSGTLTATRADSFAEWFRSIVPQRGTNRHGRYSNNNQRYSAPGDVNNDGRADAVITSQAGTTALYRANQLTPNGFNISTLTPPTGITGSAQVWSPGNVETILGDFDGDSFSDLGVLTKDEFAIYRSNGTSFDIPASVTGAWWRHTGYQIGITEMIAGDFDANGYTDLLMVDVNDSVLYTSDGSMLTQTWASGIVGLTLGAFATYRAKAIPGEFISPAGTDVLFQTDVGLYLYSQPVGGGTTLTQRSFNSYSGFLRNNGHITAGKFVNDDANTDFLLTTRTGTVMFKSTGTGFVATSWAGNSSWTANDTDITVGDFNGDLIDDVVVIGRTGSQLYRGTGVEASPFTTAGLWSNTGLTVERVDAFSLDTWNTAPNGSDLWFTTQNGSYGYAGVNTGNGFTIDVWTKTAATPPSLPWQTWLGGRQ